MSQLKIKQIKGLTAGSILFLSSTLTVSEDYSKLNWNYTNNSLNVLGSINSNNISVTGTASISGNLILNRTSGTNETDILVIDNSGNVKYRSAISLGGTSGTSGLSPSVDPLSDITITGTKNGINKSFTLSNSLTAGTIHAFYVNGQLMKEIDDYQISGTTLTFSTERPAPVSDDSFRLLGSVGFVSVLPFNLYNIYNNTLIEYVDYDIILICENPLTITLPIISNVRKITINNNSNGIITINTSNYATIKGDTQIELGFKYTTISLVSSPINNMWIIV